MSYNTSVVFCTQSRGKRDPGLFGKLPNTRVFLISPVLAVSFGKAVTCGGTSTNSEENGMLVDTVGERERVFLDSMAVIYFIESNPTYVPQLLPVFELVDRGLITGLS